MNVGRPTSHEEALEELEELGWELEKGGHGLWTHGPLTLADVDVRRDPEEAVRMARALRRGLDGDGPQEDHDGPGEVDERGRWSYSTGSYGNTVRVAQRSPGGSVYYRFFVGEHPETGNPVTESRSLGTDDREWAVEFAELLAERLEGLSDSYRVRDRIRSHLESFLDGRCPSCRRRLPEVIDPWDNTDIGGSP